MRCLGSGVKSLLRYLPLVVGVQQTHYMTLHALQTPFGAHMVIFCSPCLLSPDRPTRDALLEEEE